MGFAMVVAGKYRTVTEEHDGARVHISSYASVKQEAARRVAQVILSVRQCLESWLGVPYPFEDLQVIEVNQWGWGQAPPGLIFITQEAFLTRASARVDDGTEAGAALFARGINERVAHEVAHAWFPHVAKVVRPEENWLSESLADYTAAVCLEQKMANKRQGKQLFERQLREWKTLSNDAGGVTSVYLANYLAGGTLEDRLIRRDLLYGRGPLVLHAIRHQLQRQHGEKKGDDLFFSWIRSYVRNFTFKAGETRHLITMLNQITGEDWQTFFERYIYGVETPKID
jgi:aminopeptidase N